MSNPTQPKINWRKSSRSSGQGGDCVEVAGTTPAILVRDSKDPDGPMLAFDAVAWRVFAQRVKADDFNLRG